MSLTVHGSYCFPITDHEELIHPDHVSHKTPYDPSFRNHANQLAYFTERAVPNDTLVSRNAGNYTRAQFDERHEVLR